MSRMFVGGGRVSWGVMEGSHTGYCTLGLGKHLGDGGLVRQTSRGKWGACGGGTRGCQDW